MRLELSREEARELFLTVLERILEDVDLVDGDRAALQRWRGESMTPGSEGMRELTEKLNADLERTLRDKEKSAIVRPDWK
jgi:hypothetical protein